MLYPRLQIPACATCYKLLPTRYPICPHHIVDDIIQIKTSLVELTGLLNYLYQAPMPINYHIRLAAKNLIRTLAAHS